MQATVSRSEPVHLLTSTGKPSGCTIDGFRLVRRVRGSVHQLRRPPAWSFERGILETAHEHGVKLVEVVDTETGIVYTTPLANIWRRGLRVSRGFGEQIALPLCFWRREDPRQLELF
jgi:hypothetical protein